MNKNVKIAKQLVRIAKELCALMLEDPDVQKHDAGDFPIIGINVTESDIESSEFYKNVKEMLEEEYNKWVENTCDLGTYGVKSNDKKVVDEVKAYLHQICDSMIHDGEYPGEFAYNVVTDVVDSLKTLANRGTTYMSGNFADWSKYYAREPMNNAQDVLSAAQDAYYEALGTFGTTYNFTDALDNEFYSELEYDDFDYLSDDAKKIIKERII